MPRPNVDLLYMALIEQQAKAFKYSKTDQDTLINSQSCYSQAAVQNDFQTKHYCVNLLAISVKRNEILIKSKKRQELKRPFAKLRCEIKMGSQSQWSVTGD